MAAEVEAEPGAGGDGVEGVVGGEYRRQGRGQINRASTLYGEIAVVE